MDASIFFEVTFLLVVILFNLDELKVITLVFITGTFSMIAAGFVGVISEVFPPSTMSFSLLKAFFCLSDPHLNEGLTHYYDRAFEMAAVHFRKVLEENPDDLAARRILAFSADYMVHGVPDDWNGVLEMQHK